MRFFYRAVIVLALLALALPVAAQAVLSYGSTVTGTTATSYQFDGSEGDLVTAEAVGISADLIPVLTLLDANGQQVAQAQSDPLTPGSTTLNYRLPLGGTYTLNVSGLYDKSGEFVLSLRARPISAAQALSEGHTSVRIDATPQLYHFAGPAEIHLISPDAAFSAEIRSQMGDLIAEINGLPSAVFALDSNGEFEMMLHSTGAAGTVEIDYLERPDLASGSSAPLAPTVVSTEEATIIPTETETETPAPTEAATAVVAETPVPTEEATVGAALPFDRDTILVMAAGSSAHVQ